jgi:class 3 adenylate cyclase
MATLRTTVIAKTDLADFTARVVALSDSELSSLLNRHRILISSITEENEGTIIKGEGDSFWIVFPSVTAAALAAIEMQGRLRLAQAGFGEGRRLAMRIVITVGDVLHQGQDIFGNAVNLAARLEKHTPPDEIYLSHEAWRILNRSEVNTQFVTEVSVKGMPEKERIFRVDKPPYTRILKNQYIVFTDIRGWSVFVQTNTLRAVESVLIQYDDLISEVCSEHQGVVRNVMGDSYFLTFSDLGSALTAAESLYARWARLTQDYGNGLAISIHKGDMFVFRSYVFSTDVNVASQLPSLGHAAHPNIDASWIVVSREIMEQTRDTEWEGRLSELDQTAMAEDQLQLLLKLRGAYELTMDF